MQDNIEMAQLVVEVLDYSIAKKRRQ